MVSGKNYALSAAGKDLGLGDQVRQQLEDLDAERKKKLLQQAQATQRNASPMGGAAQMLFQGAPGAY